MTMVSSASILRMLDRLDKENVCLHAFELRVGGSVRAEGYYAPFRKGEMHRMYSVSKTMTGLAIGLLIRMLQEVKLQKPLDVFKCLVGLGLLLGHLMVGLYFLWFFGSGGSYFI